MRDAVLACCRLDGAVLTNRTRAAVDAAARTCADLGALPESVASARWPGHWRDAPRPAQVVELAANVVAEARSRAAAGVPVLHEGEAGILRRTADGWVFLDCYSYDVPVTDDEAAAMLASAVQRGKVDPQTATVMTAGVPAGQVQHAVAPCVAF